MLSCTPTLGGSAVWAASGGWTSAVRLLWRRNCYTAKEVGDVVRTARTTQALWRQQSAVLCRSHLPLCSSYKRLSHSVGASDGNAVDSTAGNKEVTEGAMQPEWWLRPLECGDVLTLTCEVSEGEATGNWVKRLTIGLTDGSGKKRQHTSVEEIDVEGEALTAIGSAVDGSSIVSADNVLKLGQEVHATLLDTLRQFTMQHISAQFEGILVRLVESSGTLKFWSRR